MEQVDSALNFVLENCHFWERAGARLPALLKKHAYELERWLAKSNLPLSSALMIHHPGTAIAEHESRQFEDALLSMLDKDGRNKRQIIAWLQITYTVIAALNAKGLKLHPVRLAVDIRPSKSPFVRERVSQIAQVENWRSAFFEWLKNKSEFACPEQWHAAALLCSAMCGCLLDHRKLVILANQINKPIRKTGELTYFDFQLPYRNLPGLLLQRWFPDPLSEMLLIRAQQPGVEARLDVKNVRRILANFLKEIGVPKNYQPGSLPKFADALCVYHESKATQIDIRFASGRYVSQSLKHSDWLRLNGCGINNQKEYASSGESTHKVTLSAFPVKEEDDPSATQDESNIEIELIAPWFFELTEKLDCLEIPLDLAEVDAKNRIKTELADFDLRAPFEYARPYLQWLHEMLNGWSTTGDAFQTGTILKYFKLVVPALIEAFGTEVPSRKDAEELVAAYGNILESQPLGQHRTNLARGLRELHFFLVRKYGCESVDVAEAFGKDAEVTVVEARVISIDEYRASDEWLRKKAFTGVAPTLIEAARLVFMLAFRLGMRRMEIMMLRLCDLHCEGEPDILVRPHAGRRLKSISSKRRMPLAALLEADELERLLKWADRRTNEEVLQSNSEYLFVLPAKEHIPIERTVDLIHEAMRVVSGDDDLHLHHLRHSFASWTYLKLRIESHPSLLDAFKHLPLTRQYLRDAHSLRQNLLPGNSIPTRSAAYCVSRLLGHSGPNVSMNHYIHFSDLLVYGCARRDVANVGKPILICASGFPERNGYRHLNGSIDGLLKAVRNKWPEKYATYAPSVRQHVNSEPKTLDAEKESKKSNNQNFDTFLALDKLWGVLHLHDSKIQHEDIARELNISKETVEQLIELSTPLADKLGLSLFKDGKRERLAPPKAKQGPELQFHKLLVTALHDLYQKNPTLLASGLQIYFDCFNRQKKDVVFKGEREVERAKIYLGFLKQLSFSIQQIQIVMRTPSTNSAPLKKWKKALGLPDSVKAKFIASPNNTKGAYSTWLGIQALSIDGRSHHVLIGGIFMLVKVVIDSAIFDQ